MLCPSVGRGRGGGRLIAEVCLFMKSDSSDPKRAKILSQHSHQENSYPDMGLLLEFSVARWQNLIPSSPWIALGWRA